jgi:FkbM family methyltransferase
MSHSTDPEAFGRLAPGPLGAAVLAVTTSLPNNWLGLRLAIGLRRIVTSRLEKAGALDVERWGLKLRLHPRDNGCEKSLLFTPQMFEPKECAEIKSEIARSRAEGRAFVFVDIGANVGLFSLFVAAQASGQAHILSIEPEPGNLARFHFSLACNPGLPITPFAIALGEREGELAVTLDTRDRGGTRTHQPDAAPQAAIRVACRPLLTLLREQNIEAVDALKIDVEGSEGKVLAPFFRDAPESLLPRLIVIEDTRDEWGVDLFGLMVEKGYRVSSRTRQNVMLRR